MRHTVYVNQFLNRVPNQEKSENFGPFQTEWYAVRRFLKNVCDFESRDNVANRKEISKGNSFFPNMNIDIEIKIFFPKIVKRFSEKNLFSQDRKENLNTGQSLSSFGRVPIKH